MIGILATLVGVLVILTILVLIPWPVTAAVLLLAGVALVVAGAIRMVPPDDDEGKYPKGCP